ncbi:MAG: uroporphyrinogen-III synthase [Planctomycetes bacterium]|nr:uroporphyrinogen-III synthase [Planctomycetota bacterium]
MTLQGRTIALAEGRQLEELAALLEKEGASIWRCPLVSILDAPDPAPVIAWLRELIAERFDYLVFFTGEGVRRLLGLAERAGLRDDMVAALGKTRLVTRGPKPVQALRDIGLSPSLVASTPTTAGVIDCLRSQSLHGATVGVQLYRDSNEPLRRFLVDAGADVREVLPYVYAPAADTERVVALIHALEKGGVDVLVFTSSPQVDRLFEVADERQLLPSLTAGLGRVQVAAVGPVVADALRQRNAPPHICPEQGFVMKNLVQLIKRTFATGK